jgi:hypothetical protein
MVDADRDGDEEDINYLINDELHKSCIKSAKDTPDKSLVV